MSHQTRASKLCSFLSFVPILEHPQIFTDIFTRHKGMDVREVKSASIYYCLFKSNVKTGAGCQHGRASAVRNLLRSVAASEMNDKMATRHAARPEPIARLAAPAERPVPACARLVNMLALSITLYLPT
ncbi:jg20865 [Pararge aegeria aegeria]|uniref:Jg20865 protein n=1 Tax=Pararge aegeria aegeria TaxID=348720 RepID=A0A8S4R1C3_9NEOP|nr:jg20865 [Pararge aegeria aegeria]